MADRRMKRVLYMGTPEYASTILSALIDAEDIEVVSVFTQPDRPVGRKRVLTPPPVKRLAMEHSIEVHQPETLSTDEVLSTIGDAGADMIIVAAYGRILPAEILEMAPCINLHASLLPLYRGASPIQHALLNADEYTGVTAMMMEEGLDTGPALAYSVRRIGEDDGLSCLMKSLAEDAAELTLDVVRGFDRLEPISQTGAVATKCGKIVRSDGEVRFDRSDRIYDRYRAFEGWPGIFLADGTKLLDISPGPDSHGGEEGKIVAMEGESVTISCLKGSVILHRIQPPSKKAMSAKAYMVGRGFGIGDTPFR